MRVPAAEYWPKPHADTERDELGDDYYDAPAQNSDLGQQYYYLDREVDRD